MIADVPEGIILDEERVSVGVGKTKARHFARVTLRPHEKPEAAAERLATWLATIPVPAGQRLRLGPYRGSGGEGFRSFTLVADDPLDAGAIAEGRGEHDRVGGSSIRLRLTPSGAASFAELTAANLRRRLAILLDGRVVSAPVVMEAITGGEVVVTLGHRVSYEEADRLARLLATGPLPARLELRTQALTSGPPRP